jgi:conjugative transfer signal peptidase TraF
MNGRARMRRGIALVLAAFVVAGGALATAGAGFRVNTTASMPEGIYRLSPFAGGSPVRDTVVAICPSAAVRAVAAARHYFDPGPCPGDVEPLLKHVAAMGGDRVDVSDRGVSVNGRALPNSGRLLRDCAGRPLARIPAGRYVIAPAYVRSRMAARVGKSCSAFVSLPYNRRRAMFLHRRSAVASAESYLEKK